MFDKIVNPNIPYWYDKDINEAKRKYRSYQLERKLQIELKNKEIIKKVKI